MNTGSAGGGMWVNLMRGSLTFAVGNTTPVNMDVNGYPTGTLSILGGGQVAVPQGFSDPSVQFVFRASPGCVIRGNTLNNVDFVSQSATGISHTGGTSNQLTFTFDGTVTGADARIVFTFTSPVSNLTLQFPTGFANSCPVDPDDPVGGLKLMRVSDEAAFNADPYALTPEAISTLKNLTRINRDMGMANMNFSNEANWNYRVNPAFLGWGTNSAVYKPGAWAGSVSGLDYYTVGNAPDSPGAGFVDGEVIQMIFPAGTQASIIRVTGAVASDGSNCASVASGLVCLTVTSTAQLTTNQTVNIIGVGNSGGGTVEANGPQVITVIDGTHIALQNMPFANTFTSAGNSLVGIATINVGGRGVKPLLDTQGNPLYSLGTTAGPGAVNQLGTMTYSAIRDAWYYTNGGITPGVPVEAFASLCRQVESDCWFGVPGRFNDASVLASFQKIKQHLTDVSPYKAYLELSNEIWNNQFSQFGYLGSLGIALGIPTANSEHVTSYHGLRLRQMFGDIAPTVWSSADAGKVVRTMNMQGCCAGFQVTYLIPGVDLINSKTYSSVSLSNLFTAGNPGRVNYSGHGLQQDWPVTFTTTGTLPSPLVVGTPYYVRAPALANGFQFWISDTPGGMPINLAGIGTGNHQVTYTNTTYNTKINQNYSIPGQQPQNYVEYFGYAPYGNGTNLCASPDSGCTVDANNGAWYQQNTNFVEAGNMTAAIAAVDDDIRRGRTNIQSVSFSGTTFTTPAAHGFTVPTRIIFQADGGTLPSGLIEGQMYSVNSTSTSGCPGAVICNFTMLAYGVDGATTGTAVNGGTPGTGTLTVGANRNGTNLQKLAIAWHLPWETVARNLDAGGTRCTTSKAACWPQAYGPVKIGQYEGNLEPKAPINPSSCTTMGVTTTTPAVVNFTANTGGSNLQSATNGSSLVPGMTVTGTDMAANTYITTSSGGGLSPTSFSLNQNSTGSTVGASLTATDTCTSQAYRSVLGWKQDNMSASLVKAYYAQANGTDPTMQPTFGYMNHFTYGSWLVLMGGLNRGGDYAMVPVDDFYSALTQKFKTYDGFKNYQGFPFLLKRDLDPASNDNDPMWLEKAA